MGHLLCDESADMAKSSHVEIVGTDYSEDMILKRQLTVQCHDENTELSTKSTLVPATATPADRSKLVICCLVPVMIAFVLFGLSRLFSRCQLVTALVPADKLANLSEELSLNVVYCCVSSAY